MRKTTRRRPVRRSKKTAKVTLGSLLGAFILAGLSYFSPQWLPDSDALRNNAAATPVHMPVSYTHLDVYKRQVFRSREQTHCPNRCLSIVRICSSRTIDAFSKESAGRITCVGIGGFVSRLEIGATINVGENRFPLSFWMTTTGRNPPCSLPTLPARSA